jgi:methylphosphotriester-DNA--protein-cysteine methyltransferase
MQVHSVPVVAQRSACVLTGRAAHPRLHGQVLGYCLSRSGSGAPVAHRLLPLAAVVLVADLDSGVAMITGPRGAATTHGHTTWGRSLTVGFTPAGSGALLGVPMRDLAGLTVPLPDVLGPARAAELAEARRFGRLDELFIRWQRGAPVVSAAGEAWRRLQLADRRPTAALAGDLGIGRRRLEREFRGEIGLSPGAVARIARFQRAVYQLAGGAPLARAAVASGYADQPHLSRETRAMAGLTPAELRAIVQDAARAAA